MASHLNSAECPEKQLLVCCARTRLQPEIAAKIRDLVAQPLDWAFLLSEAAENSVTPLLERQLSAAASGALPAEFLAQMKSAARANTVRCLFLTAELKKLVDAFESRGIKAIPYKGPVVAQQAYGDITLREFEDLDIILRQSDLSRAHEVMLQLGYQAKFPWILSKDAAAALVPGEYNYRDEARRIMVELHTEITLRHFPVIPDFEELSRQLVRVSLGGQEVRTFQPEDALPTLCVHGSKDFWERLSWIADISELVQAHPRLDWDAVHRRAESFKAQRMLKLGLGLANGLLDAPIPNEVKLAALADSAVSAVAQVVKTRLLSRQTPRLGAAGRLQFRRRLIPGVWAGWRYAARLAVVPAEEDWMMLRLPPSLAPLYIALRPFRLLYKYGWPGRRSPVLLA
jgi:hypothetical protein